MWRGEYSTGPGIDPGKRSGREIFNTKNSTLLKHIIKHKKVSICFGRGPELYMINCVAICRAIFLRGKLLETALTTNDTLRERRP